MASSLKTAVENILHKLGIEDSRYVEIEAKRRVYPEDLQDVLKFLLGRKKVRREKTVVFFDQFLDTPDMGLLRAGASLRLRYKRGGTNVYLQYKGPGFKRDGLLYRSEFSTERLRHVLLEESHHDIIHFSDTSVTEVVQSHADPAMERAIKRHLGPGILRRITNGPILSMYRKDKFLVDLGSTYLEPSLDHVFAFHIGGKAPHPLSTFCEYENEIKAPGASLRAKLERLDELFKFDEAVIREFGLTPEPLDKYHRSASFFLKKR